MGGADRTGPGGGAVELREGGALGVLNGAMGLL